MATSVLAWRLRRYVNNPPQLAQSPDPGYIRAEVEALEDHQHHRKGDVIIIDIRRGEVNS